MNYIIIYYENLFYIHYIFIYIYIYIYIFTIHRHDCVLKEYENREIRQTNFVFFAFLSLCVCVSHSHKKTKSLFDEFSYSFNTRY